MINKLIIILLLGGLLFALYKYQQNILEQEAQTKAKGGLVKHRTPTPKAVKESSKKVTIDNISQVSLESLENEMVGKEVYKQDSMLESADTNTLGSLVSLDNLSDYGSAGTANDSLFA